MGLFGNAEILSPITGVSIGDGLENVIAGLGTDRDKRSHTRYVLPRMLTRFDLENMFEGSWLSKRIVCAPVDDMLRNWRRFMFADDDSNPNIEALQKEEKRLKIKAIFKEAKYWARLYGGAMIIVGLKDAISLDDLMKPLIPQSVKKGDIKYLQVVDRWRCSPSGKVDTDLTSPNFGLPLSYILSESGVEIHYSRIIRFNGEKLPYYSWQRNGMWDASTLQHVMDSVTNYDTSTAAVVSMLFEANIDVVSSEGLTELLSTKAGEAKVTKRFQLGQMMKSFNRTLILDSKESYEKKQNQFANIDKIIQMLCIDVCGASHIAMSVLFGVQSGGLDSGGDDDLINYHEFLESEREAKVTPQLHQFDEIFVRHTLGTMPDDYDSQWENISQPDNKAQGLIDFQNAQRDQLYVTMGAITEGLVASELKLRGTYQSMSNKDVELAQELGQKMDEFQEEQRDNLLNPPEPTPANGNEPGNSTANNKSAKSNNKGNAGGAA